MSDTYRRYRAIKQALMQFYPSPVSGHRERHFNTLVALICGLTGSQRAHLSSIADHAPAHGADQESVITRFRRHDDGLPAALAAAGLRESDEVAARG